MKTSIIGAAYQARSPNIAADRCINLSPEIKEDGSIDALYSGPGLPTYSTAANNAAGSGIYVASNGRCFSVNGAVLYEIIAPVAPSTTPTMTSRGAITSGLVSRFTDNSLVMCIVNGINGYYYTFSTDTLTLISDADFPNGCGTIGFLDGYFIACDPNTQQWYISGLYATDATNSWATLDFSSSESQPDVNVGLIVDHRELWIFGETTTEGFSNTGKNATFPIERITGAVVQIGCAAQHSAAKLDNTVVWLGKSEQGSGVVYRLQGFTPTRISTHGMEFAIQGYSTISDARAFSYQDEGHHFYVLSFPTAEETWVYDANTNMWHERHFYVDGEFTEWGVIGHAFFDNKHLTCSNDSGKIYEIDMDTHSNGTFANGDMKYRKWLRAWRMPNTEGKEVIIPRLTVDCEVGQGLTTGQGSDPQIMLRISRDGGHTFGPTRSKSLGALGNYKKRVFWDRNGRGRDVVFELSGTDPVRIAIKGAYLG